MLWTPPLLSLPALMLSLTKMPNYLSGSIASDERVVFFPTAANKINETHWHVPIHGWIFEPELRSKKRRLAVKGVGKLFDVSDVEERRLLTRRLMPFIADNKSMKFVNIRIGHDIHRLPRSSKNGHFVGHLQLHDDQLRSYGDEMIVHYEAIVDRGRNFPGVIHLLAPTGTSVISDIDDTVSFSPRPCDLHRINYDEFFLHHLFHLDTYARSKSQII